MSTVLHVVDLAGAGGLQQMFMDYISEAHKSKRLQHVVAAIRIDPERKLVLQQMGIPVHILHRRSRIDIRIAWQIHKIADATKASVLYGQGFSGNLWAAAAHLLASGRRKLVAHEHGTAWNAERLQFYLAKYPYCLADRVLCNSAAAQHILKSRFHISADVIINGVDFSRLPNPPRPEPSLPVVAFIGNIKPMKGAHLLAQIAAHVIQEVPTCRFVIVGTGSYQEKLRKDIASLGLDNFIDLKGRLDSPWETVGTPTVLILPSVREPLGNVLIEAAALQVPCVATRVDGTPEVLVDGITGILVDPASPIPDDLIGELPRLVFDPRSRRTAPPRQVDAAAFSEAITSILKSPSLRRGMGMAAASHARANYSIKRFSNTVESHLDSAIKIGRSKVRARVLESYAAISPEVGGLTRGRQILKRICRRPRVHTLEIGTATHAYFSRLAARAGDAPISILELLPDKAQKILEIRSGPFAIVGDLTAAPLQTSGADLIICSDVLEHIQLDKQAANELIRILAPNGRLIVHVPASPQLRVFQRLESWADPDHVREGYSTSQLESLFESAEVKIVETRKTICLFARLAWEMQEIVRENCGLLFLVFFHPFLRLLTLLDEALPLGHGNGRIIVIEKTQ